MCAMQSDLMCGHAGVALATLQACKYDSPCGRQASWHSWWICLLHGVRPEMMLEVMQARGAGEEDMDVEQIDIRALERVSPRTSLMAPEQVLRSPTAPI